MKTMILVASAAAVALSAGSAFAGAKQMGAATPPSQPIAYDQLNSYLKASPKQKAAKDWSSPAGAATGMAANSSATAPAMPRDTPTPATGAADPMTGSNPSPSGAVNPMPMEPSTPNADQGKGQMSTPVPDDSKPH